MQIAPYLMFFSNDIDSGRLIGYDSCNKIGMGAGEMHQQFKYKWVAALLIALLWVPSIGVFLNGAEHQMYVEAASYEKVASVVTANNKQISPYRLIVDDKEVKLKAALLQEKGVTYVTMSDLFSSLAIRYQYEKTTNTVIAKNGNTTVTFKVGEAKAYINGDMKKLTATTMQKNNRIYVPVRAFAELFEVKLAVNASQKTIHLTTAMYEAIKLTEQPGKPAVTSNQSKLSGAQIVEMLDESIVTILTNEAQGTGIVIGDQLVVTNYHVIEGAQEAIIETINGDSLKVKGVVATDEMRDIAIVMTDQQLGLKAATVDSGFHVQKGDKVYALGSPLGVTNTISEGLISNLSFAIFQFSAPIDHGSSGGALIDEYGNIIGMTTAKLPHTSASIGYAISGYYMNELVGEVTEQAKQKAAFLPSKLPASLVGSSPTDITRVIRENYSSIDTSYGSAKLTDWKVERDASNWLVINANIDPIFYLYHSTSAKVEIQAWLIQLGNQLHKMLPNETVQLTISFERDYSFKPRGLTDGEVTSLSNEKWKVRYSVFELQFKDQMYMKTRDI
ncbi:trypsin-like peptidase domain-containing protein [Paenibacillus yanchengensis]|uniref:Trypsin-like peptidase domain-containing protein n=1 Tax=Paenibacillus yanchengensis TaxID=2035833 RepID=A0ABW4YFM2_9BACL